MNRISLILFLNIFLISLMFSLTRGPDLGEIYFLAPTVTQPAAIYRSTDFGQTATCMDSTLNTNILFMNIVADLAQGVLYGTTLQQNFYISYDYGLEGSWIFRGTNISIMHSGRDEGHLYDKISRHSEDYGNTFINHSYNGYFGSYKASEIDNENNVGYTLVSEYGNTDTLWLLISYNNFENLEIQHTLNWNSIFSYSLTRGSDNGELYLKKSAHYGDGSMIRELWFSDDYGENWIFKNHLLSSTIVGGRQSGELFVLANYAQLMGEIKHTYIYHSLDYGETFEIYHPFSHGPDPYYANFEATPLEGSAPLTVQFTDLSSGDNIQTWEWDFNLDGTIDSYEQNPEYTYQDTGYYSIKLKISFDVIEDEIVRKYYIHVTEGNPANNNVVQNADIQLSNYPNPFNPSTEISFQTKEFSGEAQIEIYNLKGQIVKVIFPSSCHPEFIEGRE
ncbi:MAG: hypothetical protein DRI23_12445, partial [Candidatus Cloacimonadota bacterium]